MFSFITILATFIF